MKRQECYEGLVIDRHGREFEIFLVELGEEDGYGGFLLDLTLIGAPDRSSRRVACEVEIIRGVSTNWAEYRALGNP